MLLHYLITNVKIKVNIKLRLLISVKFDTVLTVTMEYGSIFKILRWLECKSNTKRLEYTPDRRLIISYQSFIESISSLQINAEIVDRIPKINSTCLAE